MRTGVKILAFSFTLSAAIAQSTVSENLEDPNDNPVTGQDRVKWAIQSTVGPASVFGGLFSAGWGTEFNQPHEYGTHWEGFGKRYGMRLTGIASGNVMEAGLGSIWGEDPRYHRAEGASFKGRVGHVVKFTFLAKNRDGQTELAYARFAGIAGSNFLSNTWRPDSEANGSHAVTRIGLGFLGRMSSNAWDEFWPDLRDRLFHRGR